MLTYRYRPANDRFADATKLSGTKGKKVSSNAGAGRECRGAPHGRGPAGPAERLVRLPGQAAGRLTVDLSGSRFDTLLAVYTGGRVKKLHRVTADDNGGAGRSSRVTFAVTKGTKYRIQVAGVKAADGRFELRWHR